MASAFTLIEDTVLGSAAASITFNTGLTDYTKFRLTLYVIHVAGSSGQIAMKFNSDSGTNYARQLLDADSTTVTGARATGQTECILVDGNMAPSGTALFTLEIEKPLTTTPARFTLSGSVFADLATDAVQYLSLVGEWNNTADLISAIAITISGGTGADVGTRAVLEGAA